ncbi:MAG: P-loop NTPase [Lachnospiraceae bacterium]|nr:P-loop NTPase [Lachnospiraceae bacterium]
MSEENVNQIPEENQASEEGCTHDCSSCGASCGSRKPESMLEPMNQFSNVKRVIGVVSGKGGVGKSLITSYLAVLMGRRGYRTAILDADITGPSIPKAFGIHSKAQANDLGILPTLTKNGTEIMSVNLLLDEEETPVLWRGPIIAGSVKQFWSEVVWGDVDYMFVDMPPGTGDVPLTVFQSLPLDGIIIVTSPQDLVSLIVAKAVNMAKAMNIPVLGLVENYSYVQCGKCGEKISVFGKSHAEETAAKFGFPLLAKLPIDPAIAEAVDAGQIEGLTGEWLDDAANYLENMLPVEKQGESGNIVIAAATDENGNVSGHFGHCGMFTIYALENGNLISRVTVKPQAGGHEAAAEFLKGYGVNVVICGGIGGPAMQLLMEDGILVVPGMQGDVDVAVASYLDGSAGTSCEANCDHSDCPGHEDGGECGCSGCCH